MPRNSTEVTALNAEFSKHLRGPGVNSESFLYYSDVARSGHSQYFSGVFKEALVMTVRMKAYSQRVEGFTLRSLWQVNIILKCSTTIFTFT